MSDGMMRLAGLVGKSGVSDKELHSFCMAILTGPKLGLLSQFSSIGYRSQVELGILNIDGLEVHVKAWAKKAR